jgi:poly(3-hydroxybutyrate) depolymerase
MAERMLYQAYQAQRDLNAPAVALATFATSALDLLPALLRDTPTVRWLSATSTLASRARLIHERPAFGIETVVSGGAPVPVCERVVHGTPFGTLVHFAKPGSENQPRVLVVAALAGHFSTLLRSTVRTLLADHDVFVTDWRNARDVPLTEGTFGFDDYVAHIIGFLRHLGPGTHVVAVCQPCPATLASVALLSEDGDPAAPRSLTLMAGPVDGRVSPTSVNRLATELTLLWFERNVITTVPLRYRGAGRRVYPGFLQLGGFMSMNIGRHVDQHLELFHDLVVGDTTAAKAIETFYDEYWAVLDLDARFYLETIDRVFQRFLLARGELEWRGRPVRTSAITGTALLTVEGGRDDICGIGQTMAAHDLCPGVPDHRRGHHFEANAGHYGVFSGSAWERQVSPVVGAFIRAND